LVSCPACSHRRRISDDASVDFRRHRPRVAVASVASHIAARRSPAHLLLARRAIDPALALVLVSGGTIGTALGVWTFTLLRSLGSSKPMMRCPLVLLTASAADVLGRPGRAILRTRRGMAVPMAAPAAMAGSMACR